ncbi:hypothetical protein M9H77_08086 [Catharanthus roseus]|uniref:Uncharacterized protein n=1 Tax=Catharanthus roseus TaxID=4058 RepID=A0ACC0BWX2_CATRO|nr:hypothetical protein M9H77_08086 [Catharanthus roseus]
MEGQITFLDRLRNSTVKLKACRVIETLFGQTPSCISLFLPDESESEAQRDEVLPLQETTPKERWPATSEKTKKLPLWKYFAWSQEDKKPWILKLVSVSCISLAMKMRKTDCSISDIELYGSLHFPGHTIRPPLKGFILKSIPSNNNNRWAILEMEALKGTILGKLSKHSRRRRE